MSRLRKRLVQEGEYLVEVEINLIDEGGGWGPYVSPEDAYKLDDARSALKAGDIDTASKYGSVYKLTPIAAGHA